MRERVLSTRELGGGREEVTAVDPLWAPVLPVEWPRLLAATSTSLEAAVGSLRRGGWDALRTLPMGLPGAEARALPGPPRLPASVKALGVPAATPRASREGLGGAGVEGEAERDWAWNAPTPAQREAPDTLLPAVPVTSRRPPVSTAGVRLLSPALGA